MGDKAKVLFTHDLDRAFDLRQGVVEGDILMAQSFFLYPRWCAARMS